MFMLRTLALVALQVSVFGQSYNKDVRPILEKNCLPCHGPQTKSGGFDLSTQEGLMKGGDRGPTIVAGNPKASLLYQLISHDAEPHMPYQADRLPQDMIDRVAEWIKAGAPFEQSAGSTLFRTQIKPILEANCVRCHNSQIKRSGLDLSTRDGLLHGGDTGAVIVPGDAKASVLYKRVNQLEQPGMPFGGQNFRTHRSRKSPNGSIRELLMMGL